MRYWISCVEIPHAIASQSRSFKPNSDFNCTCFRLIWQSKQNSIWYRINLKSVVTILIWFDLPIFKIEISLYKRLTPLGMLWAQFRVPLNTIVLWCTRGFKWGPELGPNDAGRSPRSLRTIVRLIVLWNFHSGVHREPSALFNNNEWKKVYVFKSCNDESNRKLSTKFVFRAMNNEQKTIVYVV